MFQSLANIFHHIRRTDSMLCAPCSLPAYGTCSLTSMLI